MASPKQTGRLATVLLSRQSTETLRKRLSAPFLDRLTWSVAYRARDKNFYNELACRYGFEGEAKRIQDLYLDGKKAEAAAAIPPELIDTVALVGPRDRVRERLAVYRDAGVGTLIAAPVAVDPADRRRMVGELAEML